MRWAPNIPIDTVEVGGNRLRYIKTGQGPALVLLHTLRTQLDLFERSYLNSPSSLPFTPWIIPGTAIRTSRRPATTRPSLPTRLKASSTGSDLHDVTLAGVSIGGSIVLIVAARRNPRVTRVIAINPYDYAKGRGMARSSLFGWLVTYASLVPMIGETVMRLRNFLIMKVVLNGGVADANSIPPALMKEMYLVGNRPGHYRAFLSLLRNAASWETATQDYGRIETPVLLIWGDRDWAKPSEREHDRKLIPSVEMITLKNGGHFLPLDRPRELTAGIARFISAPAPVNKR